MITKMYTTTMSLLDRVKKSLKQKDEEESAPVDSDAEEDEHPDFEESFTFYEKKWVQRRL